MSVTTEAISIERLTQLALDLSAVERTLLLDRIRDSLLTPREREIQDAWLRVAAERLEEVRSGKVEPIDAEIAFERSRKAIEE
ncbi:MAG: addiction module protein [Pyrinomonadaceae bacterium]